MRRTVSTVIPSFILLFALHTFAGLVSATVQEDIIFSSDDTGTGDIFVMSADGTNRDNLTNSTASDSAPFPSLDGSKIVFVSDRDGNAEIYVMNADATGQVNLTNNSAVDATPAWSHDGSRISFYSKSGNRGHSNTEIYLMNADGTNQSRLTNYSSPDFAYGWKYGATWSPDDSQLAFRNDYLDRPLIRIST